MATKKIKLNEFKSLIKTLIKEEVDNDKVQKHYDEIIEIIRKISRNLSDDDSYSLHEKLKAFFNRTI